MSRRHTRPSHEADAFARAHASSSHHSSTTQQFNLRNPSTLAPDAPTDDPLLDADEIGKRGGGAGGPTKRNAVNIDGYESDSSNDGFDGRVAAKRRKKDDVVDVMGDAAEEADMFADLEESGNVAAAGGVEGGDGDVDDEGNEREGERGGGGGQPGNKKKKKGVKFMAEGETVPGEVLGSKSGGHVSADFSVGKNEGAGSGNATSASLAKERTPKQAAAAAAAAGAASHDHDDDDRASSSSESEVDDETRADMGDEVDHELGAGSKKHHAPKLDAFNMRAEQEEGRFDSAGNYVRKAADPDAVHDQWLEGVSKKDMKRAKEAMERREADSRKRQVEEDKVLTSDLLGSLIERLEVGETLLEALGRLAKGAKKKKKSWGKGKRDAMDVDAEQDDAKEVSRREAVEAITGAADMLLSRGQEEIYDTVREMLARQYQRETGEAWVDPPKAGVEVGVGNGGDGGSGGGGVWQFRWTDGHDGGEVHGDYDAPQMKAWAEAGFFGDGVEFREVGGDEWSRSVRFV